MAFIPAIVLLSTPQQQLAKLQIILNKQVFKSGEQVKVDLVVKNVSSRKRAVCLVKWDGRLSAGAYVQVFKDGKEVTVPTGDSSTPAVQTMMGHEVTSDRFQEAAPGQVINVFWINFNSALRRPHDSSITKANYGQWQADTVPLSPGEYTVKGYYSFDRSTETGFPGPNKTYEFTPSAKKLFDMSFAGKFEATAKFTVKE